MAGRLLMGGCYDSQVLTDCFMLWAGISSGGGVGGVNGGRAIPPITLAVYLTIKTDPSTLYTISFTQVNIRFQIGPKNTFSLRVNGTNWILSLDVLLDELCK